MNNSISWNEYFMSIADLSSKRSKDPKTKVGACIVDPIEKHIISIGYNGLPRGMIDSKEIWESDEKHAFVVHAEANAILNTNADLHGKTVYVTMFPCNECAKLLAQKGVKKIVYKDDKFLYKQSGKYALEIFKSAGIIVERYNEKLQGRN